MSGIIWSKFFWDDWMNDPALKLCSFASQGLWMRMLCVAARHDPIGYVAVAGNGLDLPGFARLTGGDAPEILSLLGELERNGVFSRDRKGRIYSRRMIRDAKKSAIARTNGRNNVPKPHDTSQGNERGNPPSVPPYKLGAISQLEPNHPNITHLRSVADATRPGADFDEFWGKYPKRDGPNPREPARKKFTAAVHAGADPSRMIAAAARYAAYAEANGQARTRYVARAVTWLDEKRWQDDAGGAQPTMTETARDQLFAQLRGKTA